MLGANGLANFIGVVFVNELLLRVEGQLVSMSIATAVQTFHIIFTTSVFGFAIIYTLLYERPIRQYLNALSINTPVPMEFSTKARRRVLNEPFVLLALDSGIWLTAAIVYPALHWMLVTDPIAIQRALSSTLANGLVTVTLAFFLLEYILQKRLAPWIFPEGGLSKITSTLRIRIRTRLAALLFACNLIPIFSILLLHQRIFTTQSDPAKALNSLHSAVLANSLIFISIGICLTTLVSRNLSLPFDEILRTLRRVRNGLFDKKVRVTSNDEIGYTGDVINEMTEGLKEREMIKDTFGKYVAKEVRDEILSGRIPLDGEKKEVTILFSDLRNFTPMTERSDPKLVVKIMNLYFKEMADVIQEQAGLVLQFIGDEIYAVFGAPVFMSDHPVRAFRAGLEMNHRLGKLNEHLKEKDWPILQHGIGIHTGEALAANIGSPDRLSYLLVGDTVNLASRLQSLTKEVGTEMIISEATRARLTEGELVGTELRQLPSTQVKGKSHPVGIFAVV